MNRYAVKKIVSVLSCAALSALLIVLVYLCAPSISVVPQATGEITAAVATSEENWENKIFTAGEDLAAVRIADLGRLNKLTRVNYVANEFTPPGHIVPDMQIVDLTKPFDFAEKGSLIFVIMSIDPFAEDFRAQSERLNTYKIGDYWHFTLSLPKIFCASNVYRKAELVARHGAIENYDFIDFNTSYDKKTEKFSQKIENTEIDLTFYTRREALADPFRSAQIVTVHYQSAGSAYAGIIDCPLIGTESAVKSVTEHSKNLLIAFAILATVVFAVFAVLSLLKHTAEFMPAIAYIFGIAVLLLSRFLLAQSSSAPLLWVSLWLASSFIILGGALLSVSVKADKAHKLAKYGFSALAASGALFAFLCPFLPFGAFSAMQIVCKTIKGVCVAALFALIGLNVFGESKSENRDVLKTACAAVIAVAICASLFMPQVYPTHRNPLFWLSAITAVATFINVFMIFKETETANAYLTSNLHLEAARLLKDMKAVIDERDRLLQFVSHDMRKPIATAVSLSDTAIEREKDAEQIKTMQIIRQSCARVANNLAEIGAYAKFNYLAEPSQVADLKELCALLYKYHALDCDANGIVLKNLADKSCKAFVKKQGIENVVSNLIINAVEHANCSTVTLAVKTEKNKVVLSVADDGKGIASDMNVFQPYVSEKDTETDGVGLYICKNIVESMNGTLTYESAPGSTVFYISLLKA